MDSEKNFDEAYEKLILDDIKRAMSLGMFDTDGESKRISDIQDIKIKLHSESKED